MIEVGTTLTWDTKTGTRRATVHAVGRHMVYLQDAAGKPVEFQVHYLEKLIRQGVVKVDRRRRYRIAKMTATIPGAKAPGYLRTRRVERALRKRPVPFKRKSHLRLTPVANAGDF